MNFQNEYFLRFYGPTGRRFFLSGGFGYIFQRATMKEVFGFRLSQTIEGVGLEGGVHFISETSEKRRVAMSLYYLYHRA